MSAVRIIVAAKRTNVLLAQGTIVRRITLPVISKGSAAIHVHFGVQRFQTHAVTPADNWVQVNVVLLNNRRSYRPFNGLGWSVRVFLHVSYLKIVL